MCFWVWDLKNLGFGLKIWVLDLNGKSGFWIENMGFGKMENLDLKIWVLEEWKIWVFDLKIWVLGGEGLGLGFEMQSELESRLTEKERARERPVIFWFSGFGNEVSGFGNEGNEERQREMGLGRVGFIYTTSRPC